MMLRPAFKVWQWSFVCTTQTGQPARVLS